MGTAINLVSLCVLGILVRAISGATTIAPDTTHSDYEEDDYGLKTLFEQEYPDNEKNHTSSNDTTGADPIGDILKILNDSVGEIITALDTVSEGANGTTIAPSPNEDDYGLGTLFEHEYPDYNFTQPIREDQYDAAYGDNQTQSNNGSEICVVPEFGFRCASGECIPRRYRCDGGEPDCQDGSDENGCSKFYLVRSAQNIVELGAASLLGSVTASKLEAQTKEELFEAIDISQKALEAFLNSSLVDAADALYEELRGAMRVIDDSSDYYSRYSLTHEDFKQANTRAGNILEMAKLFAEQAHRFARDNGTIITNEAHHSPEARVRFLQLKWHTMWDLVAHDLRLGTWMRSSDFADVGELEEQTKMDLLESAEIIKEAMDEVLDAAMVRVGYIVYKVYTLVDCLQYVGCTNCGVACSDSEMLAVLPLAQEFSREVHEYMFK